jgi:hypothetical protein
MDKMLPDISKIVLSGLFAIVVASPPISAGAVDMKGRENSTYPETKERYIPVELWAGAEWDGKKELKMPKVDGNYRHRSQYQIKGPTEWKHP